jgi:hypothetical protein
MHTIIKELLEYQDFNESKLEILLQSIEQIPSDQIADFYKTCVRQNVNHLAAFSQIKESDFDSWDFDDQWEIMQHLADIIKHECGNFILIPSFLKKEPIILLAFVQVYFDTTDEEIEIFKQVINENGLDKDYEFIIDTFQYDDGSVAGIIADQSIKELRDYQIESVKAYYNSPKEIFLHDQAICSIPEKFMNDFSFILELISINPEIIFSLEDKWKKNTELCESVLSKDGLLLDFLPDKIKDDEDLAAIAISQNPKAVQFISDNLTNKVPFIKRVINTNPEVLEYCIPGMKHLFNNS